MIINAIAIANGGGGSKPPVLEELQITENGTYTPSTGVDGFSPVNVNVQPSLQTKATSTTITENGTSTITLEPDSNYDGLSSASVTITTNVASSGGGGKYVVPDGMKFAYSNVFNAEDFDVSQVTDMSNLFDSSKMDNLNLSSSGWITSNVTRMDYMFNYCRIASINIAGLDTSNVTIMEFMFGERFLSNGSIISIDFSMCNMSKVTSMVNMFSNLTNLTDLNMNGAILPKMNITNWGLDTCKALTVDSLVSVLNALQQLDEGTSYTCTLGSDNLAKLTDEQKAIATNKHWTLN